ncbi:MAG: hypothetical protein ACYC0V_20810, partial [Armatimonadota bacterium]
SNRADWIWDNRSLEWIEFYVDRWASFYEKVVSALHKASKKVVVNSAWTRDPFEAVYRYGVDYKRIANTGIDGIIVESSACSADMEGGGAERHYQFLAALLLIGAYAPDTKLIFLHGIKDTTEQWDVLHHAPAMLEREVHSLANLFTVEADGGLKRCADGLMACLGDGISHRDWQWLQDTWNVAFSCIPSQIVGATLIWSDSVLRNEIRAYICAGRWSTHRILYHLMEKGAPILSAVDVTNIDNMEGCILVINHHLYSPETLQKILSYKNGPVIMIGDKLRTSPDDACAPSHLSCWIHGANGESRPDVHDDGDDGRKFSVAEAAKPWAFLDDLSFCGVSEHFIENCTKTIQDTIDDVKILRNEDSIQVFAVELSDGTLRLMAKNDRHHYVRPQIDVGRTIDSIHVLNRFPLGDIAHNGSVFEVKVPGKGIVILDVKLADLLS